MAFWESRSFSLHFSISTSRDRHLDCDDSNSEVTEDSFSSKSITLRSRAEFVSSREKTRALLSDNNSSSCAECFADSSIAEVSWSRASNFSSTRMSKSRLACSKVSQCSSLAWICMEASLRRSPRSATSSERDRRICTSFSFSALASATQPSSSKQRLTDISISDLFCSTLSFRISISSSSSVLDCSNSETAAFLSARLASEIWIDSDRLARREFCSAISSMRRSTSFDKSAFSSSSRSMVSLSDEMSFCNCLHFDSESNNLQLVSCNCSSREIN
ncbi:hypothetical protein FOCC_FOCC000081 [Frankliniella occidentalis]|nr:hypothetical protein FOCC_FOCC000081 [Frankliniella occidentalis]